MFGLAREAVATDLRNPLSPGAEPGRLLAYRAATNICARPFDRVGARLMPAAVLDVSIWVASMRPLTVATGRSWRSSRSVDPASLTCRPAWVAGDRWFAA